MFESHESTVNWKHHVASSILNVFPSCKRSWNILPNIQILVKAPVRNNLVVRTVVLQAFGESISTQMCSNIWREIEHWNKALEIKLVEVGIGAYDMLKEL